jgi:hypothetical protein
MFRRHLLWVAALTLLVPAATSAQWGPQARVPQARSVPGYDEGYQRGVRAGSDDLRRGSAFNFSINLDFRRGDLGYRTQFGNRETYRFEFRRGFEMGYRTGYNAGRNGGYNDGGYGGGYYDRGIPGRTAGPPWSNGRGDARYDIATQQGYSDGYEAGLDDSRDGRRFDPVAERRYRTADRGYNNSYGPRDLYRRNYRNGFLGGYEAGFRDVAQYGRRR